MAIAAPGCGSGIEIDMQRRHALLVFALLSTAGGVLTGLGACSRADAPAAGKAAAAAASTATAAATAAALPAAQQAYATANGSSSGFTVGPMVAANEVIVFFDPQCPHCGVLWSASQPLLGKLTMLWVPVGFLRPQSTPQGALLLASQDPVTLMTEHERLLLDRKGGLPVPQQLDEALLAKVKANTQLLQKLGADSVPFILFRNAKTGTYDSHTGEVSTEQLVEMTGL